MSRITIITLCLCVLGAAACKEEDPPMRIFGEMRTNVCDHVEVDGEISRGGADYFGYCKTDGADGLEFAVGNKKESEATSTRDFYLRVTGIEGPPVEGVYETYDTETNEGIVKSGVVRSAGFDMIYLRCGERYRFNQDDASMDCHFELYAVPAAGELDPELRKFSHYVRLDCRGIENVLGLTMVTAEFWFADCR